MNKLLAFASLVFSSFSSAASSLEAFLGKKEEKCKGSDIDWSIVNRKIENSIERKLEIGSRYAEFLNSDTSGAEIVQINEKQYVDDVLENFKKLSDREKAALIMKGLRTDNYQRTETLNLGWNERDLIDLFEGFQDHGESRTDPVKACE